MGILAELKRRNVIRMAVLYLVGAWLIVQVAETVLPIFGTPVWVLQALVVLLVLGLAPALVFSWVYELTPEGLKRDAEVPPEQSIAPQTARRMDRIIIVALVIALGYFALDKFVLAPARVTAQDAKRALAAAAKAGEEEAAAATQTAAADNKSIAVLPFADLSPGRDQEYLSDGMAEEILDALAKIGDLKVAGRTSSFYFKGKNEKLQTIGEALGVAHVLEGSVRKQGEKVRITAQLVQTRDGFHLWSETYDGDLSDVFELQERIALAIAGELKLVLHAGQQAQLAEQATESGEAHQHALRGRYLFNRRGLRSLQTSVEAFKSALAIDPRYEDAWAGLAQAYAVLPEYSVFDPEGDGSLIDTFPDALEAAEQALRLDPASSRALSARAYVRCVNQFDWAGAEADYRAAVASNPRDSMARQWFGELLFYQRRFPEAFAQYEVALAEDPLSAIAHFSLGLGLWYAGEPERALETLRESLRLSPDMYFARTYAPVILLELGRHAEALEATRNAAEDDRAMLEAIIVAARDSGGNEEAVRLIQSRGPGGVVGKPVLLAVLGEHEMALDELERLFAARDPLREFLYAIPQFEPLHGNPRFQALLKQIGLPRESGGP